jgi:hypothetical protein
LFAEPLDPDEVEKMVKDRQPVQGDGSLGTVLTPDFPKLSEASEI